VVAYDANTGRTSAHVWGWTPGAYLWISAITAHLPAGITSMTSLDVGREAYLAVLIGQRLEIHVITVKETPDGLAFSFHHICAFDHWTARRGVQLHSLDGGQHRRTIVAYDSNSGEITADCLEVAGSGQTARIPGGATITRMATHSWPARSLVGTVDHRLLRYGPDDGVAEVWKI